LYVLDQGPRRLWARPVFVDTWPQMKEAGMRIRAMNWMQLEASLQRDDRCVLPLGSTEQHAYLSLEVDNILSERVADEAAEPSGVPVFPVLAYGVTPYFRAFPGSISLRVEIYLRVIGDILGGLAEQGFRRLLLVNGHGGNRVAQTFAVEWMAAHPACTVRFHNWWNAPRTWAAHRVSAPDHDRDGRGARHWPRHLYGVCRCRRAGVGVRYSGRAAGGDGRRVPRDGWAVHGSPCGCDRP
jgi:hypothetical protein